MLEKRFKITNLTGLDARNSSVLVTKCGKFASEISLQSSNITVNLKSIMGVMSLNVHKGEIIKIIVSGTDEVEALDEISYTIEELKLGKEY